MRIHSDALTISDYSAAARAAGVEIESLTSHGSRSREGAFNVNLSGSSRRRPNRSFHCDEFAATWDEWGVFLAYLFSADPELTIPNTYPTVLAFDQHTNGRFGFLGHDLELDFFGFPEDAHGDHHFTYVGVPRSNSCTKCSATRSWA